MDMKIIFGDLMTEEEQIKLVSTGPSMNIDMLYDKGIIPSIAVQRAAIEASPNAFRWIRDPSIEIQLFAVKKDGMLIHYIVNPLTYINSEPIIPSLMIQYAAVRQDLDAIFSIPEDIIDPGVKTYWEKERQLRQSGS